MFHVLSGKHPHVTVAVMMIVASCSCQEQEVNIVFDASFVSAIKHSESVISCRSSIGQSADALFVPVMVTLNL